MGLIKYSFKFDTQLNVNFKTTFEEKIHSDTLSSSCLIYIRIPEKKNIWPRLAQSFGVKARFFGFSNIFSLSLFIDRASSDSSEIDIKSER